jgi:exopolysaccharide biosynthesis polyprenyl glycosylphosphotransferase
MINGRVRTIQSDLGLTIQAMAAEQTAKVRWQTTPADLYPTAKRVFDVMVAVLMLIALSPIMLIVAVAIKLDSAGPVIFKQTRIGKNHKPFTFYKFRSMYTKSDSSVHQQFVKSLINGSSSNTSSPTYKLACDKRITRVGCFIRKTSLDELPQLINVLRGEMSIVGPRPGLPSEVAQYQEWHRKRLEVQPGLTGLWQVSGRSNLTFDEMVLLDIYYAENWSLGQVIRIMLRTIPQVLFGEGAY